MKSMTPEDRFERIERSLEFLAANQAQLSVTQGQLSANQAQLAASQAQHDTRMAEIDARLAENATQIAHNSRQIGELRELTLRIGRMVEVQAERITSLAAAEARTDERLNALINAVERYFHNGGRN
jgi:hypothetical protein